MKSWIFFHYPLEHWYQPWIDSYKQIFDAWEDGGVRGLAVGNMHFLQADGTYLRAYKPDPKIYDSLGVTPPPEMPREPDKERKLHEILDNAASRGWPLMLWDDIHFGGGSRPIEEDPYNEVGRLAQAQDLLTAFPQMTCLACDCPGEQPYELTWRLGAELFEFLPRLRNRFAALGYDMDRLERAATHLNNRFHSLTADKVRYMASGGAFAALNLFDINEDVLYWFKARNEIAIGEAQSQRRFTDKIDRKVELGGVPRTAAFSALTGQNFGTMAPYFDYFFPKHYFWHRGYDGLYGTVNRWVMQLMKWNPSLTEADGLLVVESLFGLKLPGVRCLMDLDMGFPDEFFTQTVYNETKRAIEAVGNKSKLIFWISTGRRPHQGDPMPAHDLQGIVQATKDAGGDHIAVYPDRQMGAAEWHVLSRMCGNPWKETVDNYWPGDTWRELPPQ
jgi:hypothetical protein